MYYLLIIIISRKYKSSIFHSVHTIGLIKLDRVSVRNFERERVLIFQQGHVLT